MIIKISSDFFYLFFREKQKIAFVKSLLKFYKDSEFFLGKKDELFNKLMWIRFVSVMLFFYTYFLTWFYPHIFTFHTIYILSLITLFFNTIKVYIQKKEYLNNYIFEDTTLSFYLKFYLNFKFTIILFTLIFIFILGVIEIDFFYEYYTGKSYLPKINKFFWLDIDEPSKGF